MRGALRAAAVMLALLAAGGLARAQRVALIPPPPADAVLVDAFNRLRAELRIHHFEEQVVESAPTDPNAAESGDRALFQDLASVARQADALAVIAFVRDVGKTTVDVWLLDRVSGKATVRRLEIGPAQDAASILAIRAVDLLRASLREFEPGERPPADVEEVDRRPIPPAVEAFAEAPRPRPALMLEVDAMLLGDRPALGAGYGPSIGIAYQAGERFEFGLVLAGPLVGSRWKAAEGAVSVRQELGWVEARFLALRTSSFEAAVDLGLGGHLLQAQGQASPPLLSRSDQVASWLGTAGVRGELFLSARAAIAVSLRAIGLTPRPGVAIAQDTTVVALPLFALSAGVVVGL